MDEARSIVAEWRKLPRNSPKDPRQVARFLELFNERGLSQAEFGKAVNMSTTTICLWSKGYKTSGAVWPELQAELAQRKGASLAAMLSSEVTRRAAPLQQYEPATMTPVLIVPQCPNAERFADAPDVTTRRRSILDTIRATVAAKTPQTADEVAVVVQAFRRSKYSAEYFARNVGLSADLVRQWNAGRGKSGGEWHALREALARLGVTPRERSLKRAAQRRQKVASKGTTAPALPRRAVEVRRWVDTAGNEHATEQEAERASYTHDTNVAAERLAESFGLDLKFTDLLLRLDAVIALADAAKAERAYLESAGVTT